MDDHQNFGCKWSPTYRPRFSSHSGWLATTHNKNNNFTFSSHTAKHNQWPPSTASYQGCNQS